MKLLLIIYLLFFIYKYFIVSFMFLSTENAQKPTRMIVHMQ